MTPKPGSYITGFDSSSSMLKSLGFCLHRRLEPVGDAPRMPYFFGNIIDALPESLRKDIYRWSGGIVAATEKDIPKVSSEDISASVTNQYPQQNYPGIMIGSSNGALIHLCAALNIPWLPQTFLLSVKRRMGPDELVQDVEWGRHAVQGMLNRNPDLQFHQMHDPIQDRMMVAQMGYFRIKRRTLGENYTRFIQSNLPARSTIFLAECNYKWPVTKISERHYFQVGGLGDVSADEYISGSPRIAEFLKVNGSKVSRWTIPPIHMDMPEAEWGFLPSLREDTEVLAKRRGYGIARIIFNHPEDVSEFSADLYRWWYQRRGQTSSKLFVECFAMIESLITLKTRAIPFWMAFNTTTSAKAVETYLAKTDPWDEIYMTLISNAVRGIGLAPSERWQGILHQARTRNALIGIDPKKFPTDIGSFIRYYEDLKHKIPDGFDLLEPLTIEEFREFIGQNKGRYPVQIIFS